MAEHLQGTWYQGKDGNWYRYPEDVGYDKPPILARHMPLGAEGKPASQYDERQLLYAVYREVRAFRLFIVALVLILLALLVLGLIVISQQSSLDP